MINLFTFGNVSFFLYDFYTTVILAYTYMYYPNTAVLIKSITSRMDE